MADPQQPVRTGAPPAPAALSQPAPARDPDDAEFAAFLEEVNPPTPAGANAAKPAQAAPPLPTPTVAPPKPIIHFGAEGQRKQHTWKRQTVINGNGACRVKSFRGKYSDQGLEHLDDAINEWLDAHPEVEIKFVTSTAESFEGKTREPALVLNLWY